MSNKPMSMFVGSRQDVLGAIEVFGAEVCSYHHPGMDEANLRPHFCDCKYGVGRKHKRGSAHGEESGCPELMSAHAIISAMTDLEWLELSKRARTPSSATSATETTARSTLTTTHPDLSDAIALAATAHQGQFDKTGEPYILHPLRVMQAMDTDEEMFVAILHNVVKGSDITLDDLRNFGYSDTIVRAVMLLTRGPGQDYKTYISMMFHVDARFSQLARKVKLADLRDNMDLDRLMKLDQETVDRLMAKYRPAFLALKRGI